MQKINGEVELLDLDLVLEGDDVTSELFELASLDDIDLPQSPYHDH